ncbi:MAG: protein-glutamate O-methyltransferase CheR [Anaerolineae bacterium]|nr:protein-glutamate O-methyltransferase CheR [Anaerolineae bacterium]
MSSSDASNISPLLEPVVQLVRTRYNIDLGVYRRRFLARRLRVRMRSRDVDSLEAYGQLLVNDGSETRALLAELNINLSYFMRDQSAYEALSERALQPLIQRRLAEGSRRLSVWSAGCATGEEPYSVAILLAELLGVRRADWRIQIHATDLSEVSLTKAEAGRFAPSSFRDLDAPYVGRYFTLAGTDYLLDPGIRSMVNWHRGNIKDRPRLSEYDVILCRNVLIYYVYAQQDAIVDHLLHYLAPGGTLMLGLAELLPKSATHRLIATLPRMRIYQSPLEEGA